MDKLETKITIGELYGNQRVANITLENAKFWGRPNYAGEINQFRETKRQFTVLIPNEAADELRALGWNVKTKILTAEEVEMGREPISSLKVAVDVPNEDNGSGSNVFIVMGEQIEKLSAETMGAMDRSRILRLDMELRAWNYNRDEVDKGLEEPKYSARLVTSVAVIQRSVLGDKYGALL